MRRRAPTLGWVVLALVWTTLTAQQPSHTTERTRLMTTSGVVVHGSHLRALQVLEQRPAGRSPRVRFEWEQIRDAREYVLVGRWIGNVAWTLHTREVRVTARNATTWTPTRVTLELSLPEGTHSWQLLAVFGPDDIRKVGEPGLIAFPVR